MIKFFKLISTTQKVITIIVFSMLLIAFLVIGYKCYDNYQKEKVYKNAFYFNSININAIDYHVEYRIIPMQDDSYIGILNFANDTLYVLKNEFGQYINVDAENTIIVHDDIEPFVGYAYVPYNSFNKKTVKRIIVVPPENEIFKIELK